MVPDAGRCSRLTLVLLAAMLAACARGDDAAYESRDSAGIRIVESTRGAWTDATRWQIGSEPTIDIGGRDSADVYVLHRVPSARQLRDGRIAIVNTGTAEVRLFDRTGRHLSTIGRRGQGPGEFRSPWRVRERGDSILVLDIVGGFRFNVFDAKGRFVRSYTTPVAAAGITELVDWFADGTSLVQRHEPLTSAPSSEPIRTYVSLFHLAADGRLLDSIGRFPDQTTWPPTPYVWGSWSREAVDDSTVFIGPAERYEIHRYSKKGRLLSVIRRAFSNRATSAADIESFKAEAFRRDAEMDSRPERLDALRQRLADTRFAPAFPPYFQLVADDAGNLWTQEYSPSIGEGRVWSVFNPEGIYLGDVEMPERFRVYQIGADFVLGQWRDADDVEHVRRYGIIKPR